MAQEDHETNAADHNQEAYLTWLEPRLRDTNLLRKQQAAMLFEDPSLFRAIADTAAKLSEGNPISHATYFGSLLLMLSETEMPDVVTT